MPSADAEANTETVEASAEDPEIPADPEPAVAYGEDYYSPEDVALYLHLFRAIFTL